MAGPASRTLAPETKAGGAPTILPRMDARAFAMLAALSILWGSSFVFVEVILTAVPVLTLVALRVSIAAATLWVAVLATGAHVPRRAGVWAAFALLGLLNNAVPFSLIVWGQTATTAGLAAILNATTPLFTALSAGIALADERLSARRLLGIAAGIAGVAVMIGPGAVGALGEDLPNQIAVLGAALSYATAAVFARRFGRLGVRPVTVAAGQLTASSLIMVPVALAFDGAAALAVASPLVWLAILANACLSTALAYILYFTILARAGATNVALVTVLVPVVAVLLAAATLGERLGFAEVFGMAMIFGGLVIIDGRLVQALRPGRGRP